MIYEGKTLQNDVSYGTFQSLCQFVNFANFLEFAENRLNPKSDVTT
jgi:hypothetical protein